MRDIASKEITNPFDLRTLVTDLERLVYSLGGKDVEWEKTFMENWWVLEEYNALFYDDGDPLLFAESLKKINQIRGNLVELIALKI
jgi:hypothetical protein